MASSAKNQHDLEKLKHPKSGYADRIKEGIAGSVAGGAAVLTGHPFDTIKVRMQTHSLNVASDSPLQYLWNTVSKEGFLALYKGVTSPLVGMIFENAILFPAYNQSKKLFGVKDPNVLSTGWQTWMAGASAGFIVAVVITPVELVKCRLQIQQGRVGDPKAKAMYKYKGPLDCLRITFREGGVSGLFRGLSATMAREVPGNAVFFLECMKDSNFIWQMGNLQKKFH